MAGKSQGLTCDTVKELAPQELQKMLRNSEDIADNPRKEEDMEIKDAKPKQKIVVKKEMNDNVKDNVALMANMQEEQQSE